VWEEQVRERSRRAVLTLLALGAPVAAALLLASAVPAAASDDVSAPARAIDTDDYAGMCFTYYGSGRPFLPKAVDAGARWDRFTFNWWQFEPESSGQWDWRVREGYDRLVDDLEEAGLQMIGVLYGTPGWASSRGIRAAAGPTLEDRPPGWYAPVPGYEPESTSRAPSALSSPPSGLYYPWYDGRNYWGRFVYDVVSRYGDRVKSWEMWNEVDLWTYFWSGSVEEYARLLKVGYQATKAACPDCKVLFAGVQFWADQGYHVWVLDELASDPEGPANNYFFDVMSVHLYSGSENPYEIVNYIRGNMTNYGMGDHPIWLTETGVPLYGDPGVSYRQEKYQWAATLDEAASYVIESYANAQAAGVEQYMYFRTHDDYGGMGEYFGLIRDNGTLRPSYTAYQVARTYLASPTYSTKETSGGNVAISLWGTPRGKATILYTLNPHLSSYTMTATVPTATRVLKLGASDTIYATDGAYSFDLQPATAEWPVGEGYYFIGGDPIIVIESEEPNEPPTCTVHALPATTYTDTFTVEWDGYDSGVGLWLYEIQVRYSADSQWTAWQDQVEITSAVRSGVHGHTYDFRCRALDKLGNRSDWPASPQATTEIDMSASLHFEIGAFFADQNRNDVWDLPISSTSEITLTDVRLLLRERSGQLVEGATGASSWELTATIVAGREYEFLALSADHLRLLRFTWPTPQETYTETYDYLGLVPASHAALPIVARNHSTSP
jgi:hypothetical protein